jgi:hypothetical protein
VRLYSTDQRAQFKQALASGDYAELEDVDGRGGEAIEQQMSEPEDERSGSGTKLNS